METEGLSNILLAVALVGAASFAGAATLSLNPDRLRTWLFYLVSLATGALFGNALFHLIPEALDEAGSPELASLAIAGGILGFFILEKFLKWRHSHRMAVGEECEDEECHPIEGGHEPHPIGPLVLLADGLHNVMDGAIIAGAFLIDPAAGVATTLAVILHEIPQEIGDFSLLLHAGYSRKKALLFNFGSALTAFFGAFVVVLAAGYVESALPYLAAFAAGGFLYIAGSDLLPELHKTNDPKRSAIQFVWLIAGFALMFTLATTLPDPHDVEHEREELLHVAKRV